jgi:hypothetical protein
MKDMVAGAAARARKRLATGVVATPSIFLPSIAYYIFPAVVLAWMEVTAIRLWRLSTG